MSDFTELVHALRGGELTGAEQRELAGMYAYRDKLLNGETRGETPPQWRSRETEDPDTRGARGEQRDERDEYRAAYDDFLRHGTEGMSKRNAEVLDSGRQSFSTPETRALGESTGSAGGFLVPTTLGDRIYSAAKLYSGLWNCGMTTFLNTQTGNPMTLPYNDDTANAGALVSENSDVSAGTDFVFSQVPVNAYTYTSKIVKVSWQLLQDADFDLEQWLTGALGTRVGRAIGPHMISGTGTGQPKGIMTSITAGVTGAAGTGAAGSITYGSIVNLYASVDPAYVVPGKAAWVTSPAGLAMLRNVVDGQQRPLIQPDLQVGTDGSRAPFSLLGYPIVLDPNVPTPAVNAKSLFFGSLADAYVIRRVRDVFVMRLNERYADFGQVGFICYVRMDGEVLTQSAVKAYQHGAS
jgi:HK97 family phage major capsid protein